MKPIRTLALAAAVSALATGAYASTFTLTFQGGTASGSARITQATPDHTSGNLNVGAYGFRMVGDSDAPIYLQDEFVAWCLDIAGRLNTGDPGANYKITNDPYANSFGLDSVQRKAVQAVFDANYSTVESNLGTNNIGTNRVQAGFQIALWGAVYQAADVVAGTLTDFFTTGSFQVSSSGTTNNALTDAHTYLLNAFNHIDSGGSRVYTLTFLETTDSTNPRPQNLVTTAIPLPATGFLMLSVMGLGGIGVMARRRRDKAA